MDACAQALTQRPANVLYASAATRWCNVRPGVRGRTVGAPLRRRNKEKGHR
jgi:hypothetical protein